MKTVITIEGIYSTPVASGPMTSLQTGTLLKDVGLQGDRYAQRIGTYSVLRASQQSSQAQEPGRQLTLLSADGVAEAFAENAIDRESLTSIGDLRRNVVLRGISSSDLLNAVGSIIRLGDKGALVFVHRNSVPCMYNERKNKIPGMMEVLWYAAGVACEVISGGVISVGDEATIQVNDEGYILDPGNQSTSFFVRPTERSTEMVRDALEHKKRVYKQLKESDEKGVLLLQKSYESVGLNFWPRNAT